MNTSLTPRTPPARSLLLALTAVALLLSACRPTIVVEGNPPPTATPVEPSPTPAGEPISTAIPPPAGDVEHPVVMVFVSAEDDLVAQEAGIQLAARLGELSGFAVQAQTLTTYEEVLEALKAGTVHVAWLPPLTYLAASKTGQVKAVLLTNHFGVYQYGVQFFANTASGFTSHFDPGANQNTADASQALKQFAGKRPCWTEPSSASGYILPEGLLRQNEVSFQPPVTAQTYTAVLRALYIGGICDFGATYSVSGDPRTASNMEDLKDLMDKVVVIWQSEAVIPNLNVSFLAEMDAQMHARLSQAFLELAAGEEGLRLISTATGYDVEALKAIDDHTYDPLRALVDLARPDPKIIIGK